MTKTFDILVIGSGLGGLVSALVLAKEGKSVCILEKNNQFGGNLQTFSRNKLIFDTGVHYLGGLSEGQNLYKYFTFLGIMQGLKLKKMNENGFDIITFDGDNTEYPHAQGYENFVEQLSKIFPEEKENLQHYVQEIQRVCNEFPRYNLVSGNRYNDELLYINAKDYIDSVTQNKKLQSVLSGTNYLYAGVAEKTPLYVHALTVNSYIQSAYRCIDGGSQITKLLIRELRKYDVEIHKHTEVTEFCFDENHEMTAVKTKNNKKYSAKQFISNIEIRNTIRFAGEEKFKKSFVNRVHDLEPTIACFSVYLVLKPEKLKYFNHNFYHFKSADSIWDTANYDDDSWAESYMLSCTASKKNPEFAESLTAIAYMNYDEIKQWENTTNTVADKNERGEDYETFKTRKAELFIRQLEKKIPDLRDCIQEIYTSTPLSYRDYIGGYRANMYGYVKDSHNPLKTIFSPKTKIPNLFVTGQTVNMHGILGVTIGAFVTCSEILGKEVIDERLQSVL